MVTSREIDAAIANAIRRDTGGGSFDLIIPSDDPASPYAKVQLTANSKYNPEDRTAYVSNVWVRDDLRRMGVATKIYDKIETILEAEGKFLVPSASLKRAGYNFWKNRDAAAVANDLRSHEDAIGKWAKKKYGANVRLEYRDGGQTVDVYKKGKSIDSVSRDELVSEGVFALQPEGAELAQLRAAARKSAAAERVTKEKPSSVARSVTLSLDILTPNAGILRTTVLNTPMNGAPLKDWLAELEDSDVKRANRVITDGIMAGKSSAEIVDDLIGTKALLYKDGVREVTSRGVDALVRTATNHAANVGRESVWADNSDLIDRVRWVSTLDTRTSPTCRERDGKTYPVGSGPRPPAHINCRSTTVAVVKSWADLGFNMDELSPGTRASMDGQVPSDLTYYDWLNGQSAAVQKDVLGQQRYDLWKKGGVAPDKFYADNGTYLTLDDMRKTMPGAFKRAGI